MGDFKKVKKRPIRKSLHVLSNKSTSIAEMGFRSGLKHQLKKQQIPIDDVEREAKNTYHKPFMALSEKQMESILRKVRK
jgi:hypothetical protein